MESNGNNSFSIAGGKVTAEEEQYVVEKGLKWEDSNGELFDISTDVEEANSSSSFLSQSQQYSLILFEENEKLYEEDQNTETENQLNAISSVDQSKPIDNRKLSLPKVGPPVTDDNDVNLDEDDDKENRVTHVAVDNLYKSPLVSKDESPKTEKKTGKKIAFNLNVSIIQHEQNSVEDARDDGDSLIASPTRLQEGLFHDISLNASMSGVEDFGTQDFSVSENEESRFALAEETFDDINIIPCTQNISQEMEEENISNYTDHSLEVIQDASVEDGEIINQEDESMEEIAVIPCTQQVQNISLKENSSQDQGGHSFQVIADAPNSSVEEGEIIHQGNEGMEEIAVIPCTQQIQNISLKEDSKNLGDHSSQVIAYIQDASVEEGEIIDQVDEDIIPCTQQVLEGSTVDDSQFDISSVPCSQASQASGSTTREDLDDTITTMTKLLALAEEQEAKEKMAEEEEAANDNDAKCNIDQPGSAEVSVQQRCNVETEVKGDIEVMDNSEFASAPITSDEVAFKTPLKHVRVKLLKGRNFCTPSPPRHQVDAILNRNLEKKSTSIASQKSIKIKDKENKSSPTTSTPKRAPLTNITPAKKDRVESIVTPKTGKTPVAAKVDSGLRRSPFPIGLSPVAKYIYNKPAPSTFTRVPGTATTNANPKTPFTVPTQKSALTKIPIPPSRASIAQAIQKTPGSASKDTKAHSVLRTSTYFNMNCTPPKIISNEKTGEKKRFQQLQYSGSSKLKTVNGKVTVESPRDGFVAHKHIGLRDESGNASFIQNTFVQQQNIPTQSRIVLPQIVRN